MILLAGMNYVRMFICSKYLPPLPLGGLFSLHMTLRLGHGFLLASGL